MKKWLLPLLLMLALLLCAAAGLGEQTPTLSAGKISELQSLTGEYGAPWREGTEPASDMNAFQMGQWADWFLSNRVRSLLGVIQDCEQLEPDTPLDANDQWHLRETENTLSRFEAQLEEDRLAILNGIRVLGDSGAVDCDAQAVYNRILEAESEIQQIIRTICRDYPTYLAAVNNCSRDLQAKYGSHVLDVRNRASASLAGEADKLEARENAKADFSVLVLSTQQVGIRVCDADQKPLSGATVTLTHPLNGNRGQAVTDAQGDAIFWVGDLGADETGALLLNLRVEAAGYRTREVQSIRLRSGETRSVELQKDDGTPYLIMGCFGGRDVLSESNTYIHTTENTEKQAFTIKLSCAGSGELVLSYPVDIDETVFETVAKTFTAADSDKTVLTFEDQWLSRLDPGTKVSFTIKTGGKEYTTETLLVIQNAAVNAPVLSREALFGFSSVLSARLADNVPFIGGSSLSLDIPDHLPASLVLPSGAVLFALGYDFKAEQANWQTRDAEDEARAIKVFELKGKADEALAAAGAYRDINATAQTPLLDSNEAYVTSFAKLLGQYRNRTGTLEMSGTAGATVAFGAEITKTDEEGPAPYLSVANLSMGEGFGVDVTSEAALDVADGVPTVAGTPVTGFEKAVSLRMNLRAASGIGDRDDVNVASYGYGSVSATANLAASGMTATADVESGATLRELFLRWSRTNDAEPQLFHYDISDPFPPVKSAISPGNGSSGVEPAETEQVFSLLDVAAGEPQYVQIGGQDYMFWIQTGMDYQDAPSQLSWFNLSTLTIHGQVSHTANTNVPGEAGENGVSIRRKTYADYDFAAKAWGDYVALTILSGKFSRGGSGSSPEVPAESTVATVIMKRVSEGSTAGQLEMVCYCERESFGPDDYPVMPQVWFSIKDGDVSIASTWSTAGNPKEIKVLSYAGKSLLPGDKSWVMNPELTLPDDAEIARYAVAGNPASAQDIAFYALNANGELSRLTKSGRKVLAQGDIVSFRELTGTNRLFYLERVATQTGGYAHRLRSVTTGGTITDYGIETGTTHFDLVSLDDGGVCLYWTETAAADASGAKCLVRCVRYDPDTDTACGPFTLVELPQTQIDVFQRVGKNYEHVTQTGHPENIRGVKLMNGSTGYFTEDLKNSPGSYVRHSLSRFTFGPVASAEMTAAVLTDPCVSAGDDADLVLSVKNTGNVPLSALDVEIRDADELVQTLHIDLDDPQFSTNSFCFRGASATITGENALRRISSMYDPLNHDDWEITTTGAAARSVRTDLLMPGDTHSYQIRLRIPAGWRGGNTLNAKIVGVTGETALSSTNTTEGLLLAGASQRRGAAQGAPEVRLGSGAARGIDTDAHDLMLSAQLIAHGGEDYVHITIRNRSGNTASTVTPVLTASYLGTSLYSHVFSGPMGDDFGYSMDIPLTTLTKGRRLPELELCVSGGNNAPDAEFAEADNRVRLQLAVQLCIVEHPVSLTVIEGEEAVFSVGASGGGKPYVYQWQRMTEAGQWKDIPGANQEEYSIEKSLIKQDGLTVRCVIKDQFGDSVTSDPATLTVLALPPQTGDSSQLALWLLLALSSAAALAMVCRRKRSH